MEKQSKLKLITNREVDGKNKTFSRTYANVLPTADKGAMVAIGNAIAGLIGDNVVTMTRVDETNLQ